MKKLRLSSMIQQVHLTRMRVVKACENPTIGPNPTTLVNLIWRVIRIFALRLQVGWNERYVVKWAILRPRQSIDINVPNKAFQRGNMLMTKVPYLYHLVQVSKHTNHAKTLVNAKTLHRLPHWWRKLKLAFVMIRIMWKMNCLSVSQKIAMFSWRKTHPLCKNVNVHLIK